MNIPTSPRPNNVYLRTFGTCLSLPITDEREREILQAHELAVARISGLDGIGVTERMEELVALICRSLDVMPPDVLQWQHRTDDFAKGNPAFSKPDPVERTTDLDAVMEPLVCIDLDLYASAKKVFAARLAAMEGGRSPQHRDNRFSRSKSHPACPSDRSARNSMNRNEGGQFNFKHFSHTRVA